MDMKKHFETATEEFTFTIDLGGFMKKKVFKFIPKGEERWSSACVKELSSWGSQMNVEKITKTGIRLYHFDMLGNQTKHLIRFDKIELGNTLDVPKDIPGFEGTTDALNNLSIFS